MNLPEKYLNSMKDMLKDDFDDYLESFNDKRLYGLRVNNLKISTEDFLKISPFKLTPIPWLLPSSGTIYRDDFGRSSASGRHVSPVTAPPRDCAMQSPAPAPCRTGDHRASPPRK